MRRSMPLAPPAERRAALSQIYLDAAHSAERRALELDAITRRLSAIQTLRAADPAALAAALVEQAARTRLLDQARRNAAAARANLA